MPSVRELFEKMPQSFDKQAAAGLTAVIQFDITGDKGGKWYAAIDNGELQVVEGSAENANLTVGASAEDYVEMSTGKLDEQLAFMTGRLTARGDMMLAMRLRSIFKR